MSECCASPSGKPSVVLNTLRVQCLLLSATEPRVCIVRVWGGLAAPHLQRTVEGPGGGCHAAGLPSHSQEQGAHCGGF